MTLILTFTLSGTVVALLLMAKRFEEQHKKTFFILSLICKGDERARELSHEVTRLYDEGKEKAGFIIKKQLPMRSKSLWNKTSAMVKEKLEAKMGDIRGSRLLRRSDGISEFFKNISHIEKGGGQIDEPFDESFQNSNEEVR